MKKIALFMDHENVDITLRETYHTKLDYDVIFQIIEQSIGEHRLIIGKAYGISENRYVISVSRCWELFKRGVTPVYSPVFPDESSKSLTDPMLITDMMEVLYTNHSVECFVIVTNDKDFIPPIRKIIENGKDVLVIGNQNSQKLSEECTRLGVNFISYENFQVKQELCENQSVIGVPVSSIVA